MRVIVFLRAQLRTVLFQVKVLPSTDFTVLVRYVDLQIPLAKEYHYLLLAANQTVQQSNVLGFSVAQYV